MEEQNKDVIDLSVDEQKQNLKSKKTGKKRFARADAWLKAHPRKAWAILAIILLLLGLATILLASGGNVSSFYGKETRQFPVEYYSALTGKKISESESKRPVTAVMIENSPDARPQSGLKEAGLVFESVAEGGITRFLVLYQEGKPKLIGPVRSIRPQFASLGAPFDAGVAHVGGSDIPLKKLRSGKIKDLDQFFSPDAYWRATDRFAPHNVYTSTEKLDALNKSKKYTNSKFDAWARNKKAAPSKEPNAKSISIPISSDLYNVSYSWNAKTNTYSRSQGGAAHKDRERGQIAPDVVVAMQVPHDVIRDSNSYSYPDVNTKGKAWIFQNGTVKQVSWVKKDDKSMISFTDAEGKVVKLNPGQTWVTLIKPDTKPTWK